MSKFLPIVRSELAAAAGAIRLFFRRINTKILWVIATLILFLIPATALGWWNGDSSTPTLVPQRGVGQSGVPTPLKDATGNINLTTSQVSVSSAISEPHNAKTANAPAKAQVNINGQSIPVPQNGSIHKEINNADGKTTVDISIDSSSSGSSKSNSSMNIDLNSTTSSSIDGNNL